MEFRQRAGDVLLDYSYAPCFVQDMGEGELQDFVEEASTANPRNQRRDQKVQQDHVYLVNQAHWGRWLLFRVRIK